MTDKEKAVMHELWANVNSLRWRNTERLAAIDRYRDWLPNCQDRETARYYKKWLDFLEDETHQDQRDEQQRVRVEKMKIERPRAESK